MPRFPRGTLLHSPQTDIHKRPLIPALGTTFGLSKDYRLNKRDKR